MARRVGYLIVALVLAVVLVHQYRVRISHQMVDFDVYRTAALRVVHAEPLYRPSDGHYQLKYLPAFAMAMTPFGVMSNETAKAVWFGLSVGLLLWLLWASVDALPARRLPRDVLFLLTLVLMAKFFGHELTLGQANALLGALLLGALVALQGGRITLGAIAIGLAVFVKPYAILLWPWLAFTRGRRAAALAGMVILVGLLLPVALYGWRGNLALLADWWHTVAVSTEPNLHDTDNISLAAMWAKWLDISTVATILAGLSTIGLVAFVSTIAWRGRAAASAAFLDVAALMIIVPLVSPQGWDYVLLLGTPAFAIVVDRWRDLKMAWRVLVPAALVTMAFTTFDVLGREGYRRFMDLSIVTVAALVIVLALGEIRAAKLG